VDTVGGLSMHFKIKKTTQLKIVVETYLTRNSLRREQICFLFHGKRLNLRRGFDNQDYLGYIFETDPPDEVGMEDGDVINAMLWQVGDIGIWGAPAGSSGGGLLRDKTALLHASAADAQRIMASLCPAGAPDMRALVAGDSAAALDARTCATLVGFMDALRQERATDGAPSRVDTSHGSHDEQVLLPL
jgi:hypothetical protein